MAHGAETSWWLVCLLVCFLPLPDQKSVCQPLTQGKDIEFQDNKVFVSFCLVFNGSASIFFFFTNRLILFEPLVDSLRQRQLILDPSDFPFHWFLCKECSVG